MPSFEGTTQWIGSPPLAPADLNGKVVLVDFWEYTCLNCLRTLPYLRSWNSRYAKDGLVIVGVHTPEFAFSGEAKHVRDAMNRLGITWPVALDDGRAVWNRYKVNVWPTEMLFDQSGHLVATHVGEGAYPEMEARIQALLKAANPSLSLPRPMELLPQDNYEKPGAVCYPQTPEILVESTPVANAPAFGNPAQDIEYDDRGGHKDGALYLSGYWHSTREALVSGGGPGYFLLPYHAIEVAVVMTASKPTRVRLTQDGKPINREDAGADVEYDAAGNSYVDVKESRAYHLLMNKAFGEHELRLSPDGSDLAIYDIAFESCEVPK